jgi:hypothetical protein
MSSVKTLPLLSFTCAFFAADHATAPSGPIATASIHAPLSAFVISSVLPLALVRTTRPSSPPVTICLPSDAAARIPASGCTLAREVVSPFARMTVPSPSANAAVSPRNAQAVTCDSAGIGRI